MIGVISLLSCIIWTVNGDANHFFHGSKHSYSHNEPLNSVDDQLKHRVNLHHHNYPNKKFVIPNDLIAKFEYELEFKNDIVMIQLDDEELAKNIDHIECVDDVENVDEYKNEITQISLAFKSYEKLLQFTTDLKSEIENISPSNYSFIIVSSDDNQWINCKENMNEIALLRMFNLNDCVSDYQYNYFQCNNIQNINHDDIINNGHITFHTNLQKNDNTQNMPIDNDNNADDDIIADRSINNYRRRLADIAYNLQFRTCYSLGSGATDDDIFVVVEGSLGKTGPRLLANQPRLTETYYTDSWTDIDVGTIQTLHFVTYGSDDLGVDEITINGLEAGGAGSSSGWWACATATYEEASANGCGVASIDFGLNDYTEEPEIPLCLVIPPTQSSSPYHVYALTLETTSGTIDGGPSVDEIFIIIEGTNGQQTGVWSLGSLSSSSTAYAYNINDTKVGVVGKLYLVSFKDDQMCTDNINIDNTYISTSTFSSLCVEYTGSYPTGCSVATVDFTTDSWISSEIQVPCQIMPPLPAVINPNGRTYHIELDVTLEFGFGGSDDNIGIIIYGTEGNETSVHNISAPSSSTNYVFDVFDAVDVGYIDSIHLVTFGSDDMCFDKLTIDGQYIWDNSCLFCSSYCVGYNSWQTSGCGVVDIDFLTETADEIEEIPCKTILKLGSVFEDSWAVNKLVNILSGLAGGDKTGKTNFTGNKIHEISLIEWNRVFPFSFSKVPGFTIDTTISVKNNLKLEMEFNNGTVIRYFVGMSYNAGLELIISLVVDKDLIDIDESLFDLVLWTFGINAGIFQLGVSVGIDIHGGLLVNVEANLHCTFSYNVFGDIGLEKTLTNGWSPTASMDKDYQFSCSQFNAGATAQIFVYPILFCRVDYVFDNKNIIAAVAKPYVEATVQFDGLINITAPGACYLSIAANLGLQVMLTTEIVDWSWTLFNGKWPIFEGCLDNLISIGISELANIATNTILSIADGLNLCSTSYSTTNRANGVVSGNNVCLQTTLKDKLDGTEFEIYNFFGKVDTLWNGRIYPISVSTTNDIFDDALRLIQYENYQVQKINIDDNSVNIVVLYNSIINNYLGLGIPLNCFYTVLQTINDTYPLKTGISYGIIHKNCILADQHNNITSTSIQGGISYWVYNFHQMNVRIARRALFAEFLIRKTFQTNVNFANLQFNSNDDNKIFYGGIWCNVCNNNLPSNCDNTIKSFELIIYSYGRKARLKTNYMNWPIFDLDITFDNDTNITCIGNIICGVMAYTTENNGNRYYFGEIQSECYTKTFCGNNINKNILPLFVFNQYASISYHDQLYEWESSITTIDNIYDNCNANKSNIFTTTAMPHDTTTAATIPGTTHSTSTTVSGTTGSGTTTSEATTSTVSTTGSATTTISGTTGSATTVSGTTGSGTTSSGTTASGTTRSATTVSGTTGSASTTISTAGSMAATGSDTTSSTSTAGSTTAAVIDETATTTTTSEATTLASFGNQSGSKQIMIHNISIFVIISVLICFM